MMRKKSVLGPYLQKRILSCGPPTPPTPHLLEPITNQLHLTSSVVAKFRGEGGGGTPAPLQKQAAMV